MIPLPPTLSTITSTSKPSRQRIKPLKRNPRNYLQHTEPHPSFQDTTSTPMRRIPRVISHEEIVDLHNNHLCTNLLNQTTPTPALADQVVMQTKTSSIDRDRR
jgi:hypothetical protein